MLEIIQYRTWHEKRLFLEGIDFSSHSLIVADLPSKNLWQNFLLEKERAIGGPSVLRATELWETLFQRLEPRWQLVSGRWLLTYLETLIDREEMAAYGLPYVKASTLFKGINEFIPILSHPDSIEIMDAWFDQPENSNIPWKNLFYYCEKLWRSIQIKKVFLSEWTSALLLQTENFESFWNRPLVIDVGPEIRTLEIEVIQVLSRQMDIIVLAPHSEFKEVFPWILYPYEQLESQKNKMRDLKTPIQEPPRITYHRMAGPLAEIKAAISLIQDWTKQGLSLHQIAIVAPDIEHYWPSLRWHLEKEGLPIFKSHTTRASQLGPIKAWIHRLKKASGQSLSREDLVLSQFYPFNHKSHKGSSTQNSSFDELRSQWKKSLYQLHQEKSEKAPRLAEPQENSAHTEENIDKTGLSSSPPYKSDEFFEWALSQYPNVEAELRAHFDSIYRFLEKWLMEARHLPSLPLDQWISYFVSLLNETELELRPPEPNGLSLGSLMSGLSREKTHLLVLGCSESQLKSSSGFIKGSEVLSLRHHTGHLLAHPDRDFRDFQLQFLLNHGDKIHVFFAETDFDGTEMVPSLRWLMGRQKSGLPVHEKNPWSPGPWENSFLKQNKEKTLLPSTKIDSPWLQTLSPGTLQNYIACPFKYFVEKGLKLLDPVVVDLELDPRTSGTVKHRLLELLTKEPFSGEELKEKLGAIVDQVIQETEPHLFSPQTKELLKEELSAFGLRFIQHEESYRKSFPQFYTLAREAWFRRTLTYNDRSLTFRGKIDRIDTSRDGHEAIVIDYKSDTTNLRNAGSWLDNIELQLPAYAMALEKGLASQKKNKSIPETKVIAAHYMSLKDFSRKGFTLNEAPSDLVEMPTTKSGIDIEEKQKLLESFEELLQSAAQKIMDGQFEAFPHPKTECSKCSWRYLCRSDKQNL